MACLSCHLGPGAVCSLRSQRCSRAHYRTHVCKGEPTCTPTWLDHRKLVCDSIAQPFNSLYKRCNSKVAIWSCDSTPGELHAKLRPPRLASTALLETWPCARRRRRSHQQRQSPDLHKRSLIPLPTSTRPWPGTVGIHLPATASRVSDSVRLGSQCRLNASEDTTNRRQFL